MDSCLSGGVYTTIDVPGTSLATEVAGINNSGQIVGQYRIDGFNGAFLLSGGLFTTIDLPGSTGGSRPGDQRCRPDRRDPTLMEISETTAMSPAAVPEPSTFLLGGLGGLAGLGWIGRRLRHWRAGGRGEAEQSGTFPGSETGNGDKSN